MNDDDLLFPMDDLDRWKRRELPKDWLANRQNLLLERLRRLAEEAEGTAGCPTPKWKPINPPRR
ncbi:hypothetical protein ACFPIF_14670 [Brevundimonas faecalis]|uniref:hypothetical protein n=1 Tax=Brevundimonas faecalis TaxID=947378 RepID=UPI00360A833C